MMDLQTFKQKYRLWLTPEMEADLDEVDHTAYERGYNDGERSAVEFPQRERG